MHVMHHLSILLNIFSSLHFTWIMIKRCRTETRSFLLYATRCPYLSIWLNVPMWRLLIAKIILGAGDFFTFALEIPHMPLFPCVCVCATISVNHFFTRKSINYDVDNKADWIWVIEDFWVLRWDEILSGNTCSGGKNTKFRCLFQGSQILAIFF